MRLQLLPSAHGATLQSWAFDDQALIQIGRASECDVVIAHPVVSRSHAYLKCDAGRWHLSVISQNGVYVDGERVQNVRMSEGLVFRLASTGPFLRFCGAEPQNSSLRDTVVPDESTPSVMLLDVARRDRQVEEIAHAPFFHDLRELAKSLRSRNADDTRHVD
ncbi:MAG: FHA domain-containing protein [Planctomycetaceae bacterium]|nr:FHA domain-containing protein [Planctomycetaceae bacterium]